VSIPGVKGLSLPGWGGGRMIVIQGRFVRNGKKIGYMICDVGASGQNITNNPVKTLRLREVSHRRSAVMYPFHHLFHPG